MGSSTEYALPDDAKPYDASKFIETYTGRKFFPITPEPTAVSIIDIAHALSNQCRYSGHVKYFYSVAQHCCLLASYAETVLKASYLDCLQILMHDAAETYLVDMPRPVKQYMPEFRKWDENVNEAIRIWMGLGGTPMPSFQGELDSRVIKDERAQLMSDSGNVWGHDHLEPLGIIIAPWTPEYAERQFLLRYAAYSRKVYGTEQYLREGWGIPMKTQFSSDAIHYGAVSDLLEVDLRGGVGKVRLRQDNGMMVRDLAAGAYPKPAWKWMHGKFILDEGSHVSQQAG